MKSPETRIVTALLIVCGLTTNGFICAAFVCCRRLQTVTNYFVVNLAVSGIISFLCLTAWELVNLFPRDDDVFLFLQSWDIFAASLSAASVTAIAFDRYYAVSRPLRYSTCVTHKKAVLLLAAVWTYAVIIALMTWFRKLDPTMTTFRSVLSIILILYNFVVALVLCLFCYVSILFYAWPHLRQNSSALRHCAPDSRGFALAKHLKITFTIVILSAPLMFGWSIFYIITTVETFITPDGLNFSRAVQYIVSNLPSIIAAINAIAYVCLTKDFRSEAAKLLRCRQDRARVERLTTMQSFPPSVAVRRSTLKLGFYKRRKLRHLKTRADSNLTKEK